MNAITPLIILMIAVLLLAGCADPVITPTVPPSPPPPPTVTTPAPDLVPRPTDVVPPSQQVAIQVTKNTVAIDPWVSVLFAGGPGQLYVYEMTGTLIRSDGKIETRTAPAPLIGTNLLFSGTTGTDRVIVTVRYTDGNTYTVKDELVQFRGPNP